MMDFKKCYVNCKFAKKINNFDDLGNPIDDLFLCLIYNKYIVSYMGKKDVWIYWLSTTKEYSSNELCQNYEKG